MSSDDDAEVRALLERMSPEIADLMLRMMKAGSPNWVQARAFRDEIVKLNQTAKTNDEQTSLAFAFVSLMDRVEQLNLIADESLEHFRAVRAGDYRMLLNVQALVGDLIDPERLEYVTRREVEAGRLAADDDFRKLAVAGAMVLGKVGKTPKSRSWLGRLFGKS